MTTTSHNGAVSLSERQLELLDRYWRAANYLSVGQIYLLDNPLLREPLRLEHIKPRLLGHWGTTPGLNFIYAHLNRLIRARDLSAIYVTGPGHGGPGLVANTYLEGTYSEVYPHTSLVTPKDCGDCFASSPSPAASPVTSRRRRRDRSTRAASSAMRWCMPTARPSTTPTCWCAAWSATARPRPGRWRRAGIPTSSSTPRATARCCRSCISTATRSPTRPSWRAYPSEELRSLLEGYGYAPRFVEGSDPSAMHSLMAATLDEVAADIDTIQRRARTETATERPSWPMIVLRTPKGWTGPEDRRRTAGRGLVSLAPGSTGQPGRQPGTPRAARGVDALLPARGAVRRGRDSAERAGRAGAARRPADGRQPSRQWRSAVARPRASRLPDVRARRSRTGAVSQRAHAGAGRVPARRRPPQRRARQLPAVRTR